MDLFSSRSQRTITCDYNISDTFSCTLCATFFFLLYFDLNCDLYLNRFMVPWNLFVNYNREFGCLTPDSLVFLQIILGFCKCHGHWLKSCGKKEKNATPKVSCVLVHFALKRKYKLALTSEQLCAQCISSGMRLKYQMPALLIILKNCEKREMFYPNPSISFLFLVFMVMSWMSITCL